MVSESVLNLRDSIARRFPEDARCVNTLLAEAGWDESAPTQWFEQFSQRTTDAMRERDEARVRAHLVFMSEQLEKADAWAREYIDVYYVEPLMWDLDEEGKRWGIAQLPQNLKALYVAVWHPTES